eukprot:2852331-Rhodomonas_salina.1
MIPKDDPLLASNGKAKNKSGARGPESPIPYAHPVRCPIRTTRTEATAELHHAATALTTLCCYGTEYAMLLWYRVRDGTDGAMLLRSGRRR